MSSWTQTTASLETAGPRVVLACRSAQLPRFLPLLQQGVEVRATANHSVRAVLCQDLGLAPAYVEARIQTIFLDGKPVDDLDHSRVSPGATLALSAAMPGLVGAILRRGSYYAAMRREITHREEDRSPLAGGCLIKLKLFNLLAADLGAALLARGIWLSREQWQQFLQGCSPEFWSELQSLSWNDASISPTALMAQSRALLADRVQLTIRLRDSQPAGSDDHAAG